MLHKLRNVMGKRDSTYKVGGIVELDEGFFTTEVPEAEKGKPLKWEFKPISSRDHEVLRDECTIDVQIPGKPNMYRQRLNTTKYFAKLIAASTVEPNLDNKELQESYGVQGAENLVFAMVDDAGEYQELCNWLQKYLGFTKSLEDQVNEAKN